MKETKKQTTNQETKKSKPSHKNEIDRSAITGIKMGEDISGATKPGSAVRPDILREDHPGLAK